MWHQIRTKEKIREKRTEEVNNCWLRAFTRTMQLESWFRNWGYWKLRTLKGEKCKLRLPHNLQFFFVFSLKHVWTIFQDGLPVYHKDLDSFPTYDCGCSPCFLWNECYLLKRGKFKDPFLFAVLKSWIGYIVVKYSAPCFVWDPSLRFPGLRRRQRAIYRLHLRKDSAKWLNQLYGPCSSGGPSRVTSKSIRRSRGHFEIRSL